MTAHLLLVLLFFLTIGLVVMQKLCSVKLDHRSAPLFFSGWTLLGLIGTWPVFGHLWLEGWPKMAADPTLLALIMGKGALLYYVFFVSQRLMKVSLSSRHYVTPLAVGLVSISNFLIGEELQFVQWFSALGLCALSAAFFFKGHLADLDKRSRWDYFLLVALSAPLASLDHFLIKHVNWFSVLLVSNIVLLTLGLLVNRSNKAVLRHAFMNKTAALAGIFYMAAELVKFYQQVTINPVTVVITVQAATKPVILILSAIVWRERTVREQLIWGILAFLVTLPLFLSY